MKLSKGKASQNIYDFNRGGDYNGWDDFFFLTSEIRMLLDWASLEPPHHAKVVFTWPKGMYS